MKKYYLMGLIITLLVGLLYNTSAQQTANKTDLEEGQKINQIKEDMLLPNAIEKADFRMEEFNINLSLNIPNTFLTMEDLEEKQKEIMEILNIHREVVIVNMDNMHDPKYQKIFEDLIEIEEDIVLEQRLEFDGHNEIIRFVPTEDGNMTTVKLLSTRVVGENETYIIVDIVQNKGYKDIVGISNQLKKSLSKYGEQVETTINLTGIETGKISKAEEKKVQDAIFNYLKAKKVEILEDELFTSITAYSPLIETYINYGGKNVNIQLAIRYSEYEDKTYLWIGTPLITTTY